MGSSQKIKNTGCPLFRKKIMKIVSIIFILFFCWSCNDCGKIRCAGFGMTRSVWFTMRDKTQNLIISKKIDLKDLKVYQIDTALNKIIKINVINMRDSTFELSFNVNFSKLRIHWQNDSIDLNIKYQFFEGECCDYSEVDEVAIGNKVVKKKKEIFTIQI